VTLLDAYALVAFLVGGPAAAPVRALLREGDAAVATVNLAETLDVSERVHGLAIDRARKVLDPLFGEARAASACDAPIAESAATIRARHYRRTRCAISLGDSVLLASAAAGDRIATADPAVLAVAEVERIATVRLPGDA
jgi:PIN domain nuclease of toxin-antitoxin system